MGQGSGRGGSFWLWLLLVPYVIALWVPFYNSVEPSWHGIPFFYWYQFLCIAISSGITGLVYFMTRHR